MNLRELDAETARLIRSGRNAKGQTQEEFWKEIEDRDARQRHGAKS